MDTKAILNAARFNRAFEYGQSLAETAEHLYAASLHLEAWTGIGIVGDMTRELLLDAAKQANPVYLDTPTLDNGYTVNLDRLPKV